MTFLASLASLLILTFATVSHADKTHTLDGKVISVLNASTLLVRDGTAGEHLVRLAGIIPVAEDNKLYKEAKLRLAKSVTGKKVTVEWDRHEGNCDGRKFDKKCEKFGKVIVENRDINLELIAKGLATHDQDSKDFQSTTDRSLYAETEEKARKAEVGMWNTGKRKPAGKRKKRRKKRTDLLTPGVVNG